jgi:hypothetical protein
MAAKSAEANLWNGFTVTTFRAHKIAGWGNGWDGQCAPQLAAMALASGHDSVKWKQQMEGMSADSPPKRQRNATWENAQ